MYDIIILICLSLQALQWVPGIKLPEREVDHLFLFSVKDNIFIYVYWTFFTLTSMFTIIILFYSPDKENCAFDIMSTKSCMQVYALIE
jgi:hypothetical protein